MECPICYDAIDASTGITTLSCSHSFHLSCISGWFLKQEIGTCPCCRTEMAAIGDLPRDEEASDDDDDDDEEDEVDFTRAELQAFLASLGGNLTDAAAEGICDVIAGFNYFELNALVVGNTGQPLTHTRWCELVAENDDDDDDDDDDEDEDEEDEEDVWNLRISTTFGPEVSREISMITTENAKKAATKLQAVWRGFKGRVHFMEKRAAHTLANIAMA
jgi:hypothetical protein